jgi:Family of unknown function (DUF5681)
MTTENSESKHLWKPGVSGNPSGKPRGTKSKSTQLVQALISRDPKALRDVVDVTIAAARNGKPWAVELILARLWPAPKGRTVTFLMDEIRSIEDISRAYSGLWAACSQGLLTPDETVQLSAVLKDHAAALESKDLEARIAKLEQAEERRLA